MALHDVRRLAPRAFNFTGTVAGEMPRGAAGGLLGTDLQGVDALVVDPGTLVIKGRL